MRNLPVPVVVAVVVVAIGVLAFSIMRTTKGPTAPDGGRIRSSPPTAAMAEYAKQSREKVRTKQSGPPPGVMGSPQGQPTGR